MNFLLMLLVICFYTQQIYCKNPKVIAMKTFKAITNPDVYDRDLQPNSGVKATEVGITLWIISFDFNPSKGEMSFIAYFRQKWNDPRLVSQAITADVVGGQSLVDRVWIPDTFFVNSIDVDIFKYPIRNSFIKVKPNGDVLYNEKIEVEFLCNSYKMQTNETVDCDLVMESYSYSTEDIEYSWAGGNHSILGAMASSKYKINQLQTITKLEQLSSANYSRLEANFKLTCNECVENL